VFRRTLSHPNCGKVAPGEFLDYFVFPIIVALPYVGWMVTVDFIVFVVLGLR
jgi:hypothetical protein